MRMHEPKFPKDTHVQMAEMIHVCDVALSAIFDVVRTDRKLCTSLNKTEAWLNTMRSKLEDEAARSFREDVYRAYYPLDKSRSMAEVSGVSDGEFTWCLILVKHLGKKPEFWKAVERYIELTEAEDQEDSDRA